MKKMSSRTCFGILGGIVLGLTFAAYAASVPAAQVTYSNSATTHTTAKGAIDELLNLSQDCDTRCPKGYICSEKQALCKRVGHSSELHTETCNQTSNSCAATRGQGHTITYGNVGTKGTLAVGDAFDCDVMGDGSYMVNGEAARFYYVSTMAGHSDVTDSNYAVLVYYTNVVNGHNSTLGAVWASNYTITKGPVTAKNHLPGNAPVSWPGVSLKSSTRRITNELGTPVVDFDYGSAQARLLTYQEVYNGCYDGSRAIKSTNGIYSKCEFLLENTKYTDSSNATYGPWLETPYSSGTINAWRGTSFDRCVYANPVYGSDGVRPAIEVPLTDIDY